MRCFSTWGIGSCIDFEDFGRQLREHVRNGPPDYRCVGMGPTKTLAKSAQWLPKSGLIVGGVLALTRGNIRRRKNCCHCSRWRKSGGRPQDLKEAGTQWDNNCTAAGARDPCIYQKNFNVVLERTVRELTGESCISLEEAPPPNSR